MDNFHQTPPYPKADTSLSNSMFTESLTQNGLSEHQTTIVQQHYQYNANNINDYLNESFDVEARSLERLANLTNQIRQMKAESAKKDGIIESLQNQLSQLANTTAEYNQRQNHFEFHQHEFRRQETHLKETISTMRNAYEQLLHDKQQIERQLTIQLTDNQAHQAATTAEIQRQQVQIAKIEYERDTLRNQITAMISDDQSRELEIQAAQQANRSQAELIESLKQQIIELQFFQTQAQSVPTLQQEVHEWQKKSQQIEQMSNEQEDEIRHLTRSIAKGKEENRQLKEIIEDLETRLNTAKQRIRESEHNPESEHQRKHIRSLTEEVEKHRQINKQNAKEIEQFKEQQSLYQTSQHQITQYVHDIRKLLENDVEVNDLEFDKQARKLILHAIMNLFYSSVLC